jgi:DNA-binding FadR family transcriptional regulator
MELLHASRTSVREALQGLQSLGIVDIQHGRGMFVGNASLDSVRKALVFRARVSHVSDELGILPDLMELHEILETHFIANVTESATADDIEEMRKAVEHMNDPALREAADRNFHSILYRSCGNSLLLELLQLFWDTYSESRRVLPGVSESSDLSARNHDAIVSALAQRDSAKARLAIAVHFNDVRRRLSK